MEQVIESATPGRNKAMIKAFMFVAFVIMAIYIVKFTPVKGYLTAEALGNFLNTAGVVGSSGFCICLCRRCMSFRAWNATNRYRRCHFWGLLGVSLCLVWSYGRCQCSFLDWAHSR